MKKPFYSAILALGCSLPLSAQVLNPGGQGAGGAARPSAPSSGGGGNDIVNNYQDSSGASVHGQEIPIVDPTQKTVKFQNREYSIMDNHLGGQFEAFLATDTLSLAAAAEYRATIQEILDLVAPDKAGGVKLKEAYKLLSKAAEYPGDGNLCESLRNSVYSSMLTKHNIGNKKELVQGLREEREQIIRKMGVIQRRNKINEDQQGGKAPRKQGSATQSTQTIEYLTYQKRIIEIEALIKKLELEGTIDMTQSKLQFQAMMVQLFMQRRFEHVVMSARLYNTIYKDGDTRMRLKRGSDTEKFFSEGIGINPTVAGMDAAANEAITKVKTLVSALENNLRLGRIHAASERAVEAFAIGEYLPSVQTISIEKKERILKYVQDANDLVAALKNKDLERAERLHEGLKEQASDYDSSAAQSYISGHKRESNFKVTDASMALFQMQQAQDTQSRYNEEARFKVALREATLAWPSNPRIQALQDKLDAYIIKGEGMLDDMQQTRDKFDRLLSDKNYRLMIEEPNKSIFTVAFGKSPMEEDKDRLKTFEEVANSLIIVERAIAKAEDLEKSGQPHMAWEEVYAVQERYNDDKKIADLKARLAGKVANFTNTLTQAETFEKQGADGSALNWYVRAQKIHPQSKFAKDGIERILDKRYGKSADKAPAPAPSASEADANIQT